MPSDISSVSSSSQAGSFFSSAMVICRNGKSSAGKIYLRMEAIPRSSAAVPANTRFRSLRSIPCQFHTKE